VVEAEPPTARPRTDEEITTGPFRQEMPLGHHEPETMRTYRLPPQAATALTQAETVGSFSILSEVVCLVTSAEQP
jgi:hypothetical protein